MGAASFVVEKWPQFFNRQPTHRLADFFTPSSVLVSAHEHASVVDSGRRMMAAHDRRSRAITPGLSSWLDFRCPIRARSVACSTMHTRMNREAICEKERVTSYGDNAGRSWSSYVSNGGFLTTRNKCSKDGQSAWSIRLCYAPRSLYSVFLAMPFLKLALTGSNFIIALR